MGGWEGGRGSLETILRNTHAYTELNVSQYGKTDRRTRIGYKDRQKKEAFVQMAHTGDALNLNEAVVQRAKELFAGFRDDRELVQQFKGVLAACLCEAFEQLAREGKGGYLVKNVGAERKPEIQQDSSDPEQQAAVLTGRAARRNELHNTTLAGRGGIELDFSNVAAKQEDKEENGDLLLQKPAATWDLEDCRSWLLEASRTIAQEWVRQRQEAPMAEKSKWPTGSLEELEGNLVEHSITLCEHLEEELNQAASNISSKQRVITPRVNDMSKLGIKWQRLATTQSSGSKRPATVAATSSTKTAGQVLILKTAKKLASVLNDDLAGEAIHRELRAVVGKQDERKRQKVLEEKSRQRFHQMQRKPWLQARAQVEN